MKEMKQKAHDALRWSERYTKTDMVYVARGGFWLTLIQVVGAASAFILSIFFAHLFPKDAYGNYKYVIALSGIIGTLTLSGLGLAVTQSVSRGFDGSLRQGFRENFKWSIGIVVISFAGAIYYLIHFNLLLSVSLLIIGLTSPLIDGASLFSSYLNGKKDFRTLAVLTGIGSIFPALALIVALLLTTKTLIIITVYFLSYTLAVCFSYFFTLRKYNPPETSDREMVPYAKHLTLMGILNSIADQADKVIVYHYVGAVELAIYSFATALPLALKGVIKGIYPLAMPRFATRSIEDLRSELPAKMLRLFFVLLIVVGVYILAAPFLYRLFFPQYLDSILISQIFAISLIPTISIFPSTLLQAKKQLGALYRSNIIFSIIKLATLFAGAWYFGFWGIVGARVIYEYFGMAIYWFYAYHFDDKTFTDGLL